MRRPTSGRLFGPLRNAPLEAVIFGYLSSVPQGLATNALPPVVPRPTLIARGTTQGNIMNVETRLARLESQNRWLRASIVVVALLAVVPWVMGSRQEVLESVRTKELTIVDVKGVTRGSWHSISDDQGNAVVTLELYGNPSEKDGDKEITARLMATPHGSTVAADNGTVVATKNGKAIWRAPTK